MLTIYIGKKIEVNQIIHEKIQTCSIEKQTKYEHVI